MMDDQQFQILIQELQTAKQEIIDKLEEIRCGIIDVENILDGIHRVE